MYFFIIYPNTELRTSMILLQQLSNIPGTRHQHLVYSAVRLRNIIKQQHAPWIRGYSHTRIGW